METYDFVEHPAGPGAPLLLLFHGTGGNEHQFMDLGGQLMPDAHLIAPRGDVSEGGALRFFRRLEEGIFDMADLARATRKMAAFIAAAIEKSRPASVAALGYSNGANILASVLFEHPGLIGKAVIMHPLIPFAPKLQPGLRGRRVLITAGRRDPIAPAAATQSLADYFSALGAETQLVWHDGGHELRREEVLAAQTLLGA